MTDISRLSFTVHDDPPADDVEQATRGLDEHNAESAPVDQVRRLASFARNSSGSVIGGAVGRTWGECCELQTLWVDPEARGRGIARRLLTMVHERAECPCRRGSCLGPASFQHPELCRGPAARFRSGYPVTSGVTTLCRVCKPPARDVHGSAAGAPRRVSAHTGRRMRVTRHT